MNITEKLFWEDYWGEIKLPVKVDLHFKNDRVITEVLEQYIPRGDAKKLALEVGCAPGKWMLFIYEKLNYSIDGFEYLDVAAEKTRENFIISNVPMDRFKVITADFLTQIPVQKYDLVTSFGFIEHFTNYEDIFQKHLMYAKKDAYVVVGFPNFRGLNYYLQFLIDKISGSKIIENHNISMMNKETMQNMIKNSKKQEIFIDYIGGFEPALFNVNDIKNSVVRFLFKVILKLLSYPLNSTKCRYLASYLIFVVKND